MCPRKDHHYRLSHLAEIVKRKTQKSEGTFAKFLALPGQTTRGSVTTTKCHGAARPSPGNENLTLSRERQFSPRGPVYGFRLHAHMDSAGLSPGWRANFRLKGGPAPPSMADGAGPRKPASPGALRSDLSGIAELTIRNPPSETPSETRGVPAATGL